MTLRRTMVSVLAFWLVAMLLPTDASAQFRLRVEDITEIGTLSNPYGFGAVVSDDGVGDDNPVTGIISLVLNGLGGGIDPDNPNIQSTFGITKPVLPVGLDPTVLAQLQLTSMTVTTSGAITLRLTLEDTSLPTSFYLGGPGALLLTSSIVFQTVDVLSGATVTSRSWANVSNYAPALGLDTVDGVGDFTTAALDEIGANLGDATAPLTFGTSGPTTLESSAVFTAGDPLADPPQYYALTTQITLEFLGAGTIDFSQDNIVTRSSETQVPEPASLLLIATGIAGGLARAKRRRAAANRPL